MNKLGRFSLVFVVAVFVITIVCIFCNRDLGAHFGNLLIIFINILALLALFVVLEVYEKWVANEVLSTNAIVLKSKCLEGEIYKGVCIACVNQSIEVFDLWSAKVDPNTMRVNWEPFSVRIGFYRSETEDDLAKMISTGSLPNRAHNFFSWVDYDGKGRKLTLHPANDRLITE